PLIVLSQPGIAPHQLQHYHEERAAQPRVAQRDGRPLGEGPLAGLSDTRDHADVTRNRAGAIEARRIPELCDQAGRRQWPHPFDGHDQLGDLMLVYLAPNIPRQVLQPTAEQLQVLTQVLVSQAIWFSVMGANRLLSRFNQIACELFADLTRTVANDPC